MLIQQTWKYGRLKKRPASRGSYIYFFDEHVCENIEHAIYKL